MAFQGEYFMDRYGRKAAERTPPVRRMLELGIPVGAGTDATRVASYNPWVSLYWLVTGKTVGGVSMYPEKNCLSREEALRLYTQGSSWFSSESGKKGAIVPGQLADMVVLSDDYFSAPEERIKGIESVLTIVGGNVVHAADEFASQAPPPIPVLPEWSPVKAFGGYGAPLDVRKAARAGVPMEQHQHSADRHNHGCSHAAHQLLAGIHTARNRYAEFFGLGCDCFAFWWMNSGDGLLLSAAQLHTIILRRDRSVLNAFPTGSVRRLGKAAWIVFTIVHLLAISGMDL